MNNSILCYLSTLFVFLSGCNCIKSDGATDKFNSPRRYVVIQKQYVSLIFDLLSRNEIDIYLGITPELRQGLMVLCYPTKQELANYAAEKNMANSLDEIHLQFISDKISDRLGGNKYSLLQDAILQVYGPEILFTSPLKIKAQFGFSQNQQDEVNKIIDKYNELSSGIRKELGRYWIASSKKPDEIRKLMEQLAEYEHNKDLDIFNVFTESQVRLWDELTARNPILLSWPVDDTFRWKGF